MWLCFVPAGCLADPLLVIHCSQDVCDCVLSLLDVWLILCLSLFALSKYVVVFLSLQHVWLILCLSFHALRQYVVVFCPCWMSG